MTVTALAPKVFEGPLDAADARSIAELGRVLISHGFAGPEVLTALGTAVWGRNSHVRDDVPLYLRRLAAPTPLNTLIKLFVLLQPVDESAARAAMAPVDLDAVMAMGLIRRDAAGVTAQVRVSGYCGLLLAHDSYDRSSTIQRDHVLDVNPTTNTLAALTVRRSARSAVDVGTGCGVMALLVARHCGRVVGIDTNARALNFAVFNAALNDAANVEFRQGSLFDPVAGERFDLIVCNPPYVISPESRYIFRDGNRRGDAFSEEVVRRAPDHLEAGGYATVLCNWGIAEGQHWSDTPRRWVDGSGCDAWLLCSRTQDPLTYTALWNRGPDLAAYAQALDRWPAYYRELGFTSIGLGGVVLRRRSEGEPWIRCDMLPDGPLETDDALIPRIFESQDRLARLTSDEAVLSSVFIADRRHSLEQTLALDNGAYTLRHAQVRLAGGIPFHGDVDPQTIHLLERCDGRRSLDIIAGEIAARTGADPAVVKHATAAIAMRLAALGFLVPVDGTEGGDR